MAERTTRRRRRLIVGLAIVGALTAVPAGSASAHVHGVTPLRCVGAENAGAIQTDQTPASAENEGPISGLIPRDVAKAPLTMGDGGFDTPACPA